MNKYLVLFLLLAFSANAQAPKMIADYDNWKVYFYQDDGQKACYIRSTPIIDSSMFENRGDAYITISSIPGQNSYNVVSINAGYDYKEGSNVKIKVGSTSVDRIFIKKDQAWAVSPNVDAEIINLFNNAQKTIVEGTTQRGIKTNDVYSLKGFNEALHIMNSKCPR